MKYSECDEELNSAQKVVNFAHNLPVLFCTSSIVSLRLFFFYFPRGVDATESFVVVFGSTSLLLHALTHAYYMFCILLRFFFSFFS